MQKEQIENFKRPIGNIFTNGTFDSVLQNIKKDTYIACRDGWNNKGMYIYYVPKKAYQATTSVGEMLKNQEGLVEYEDYLALFDGEKVVAGWRPTFKDMFEEDWILSVLKIE